MTSTPRSVDAESLNDSWCDINENPNTSSNETPLHMVIKSSGTGTVHSLEKLLMDAQKESGHSSMMGSLLESCPITPNNGMQTPPNSVCFCELNDRTHLSTDWLWDWSHRDPLAKEWGNIPFRNRKTRSTVRQWIIRRGILSKEVLSILFFSNVLSLLLGAGIGCTMLLRKSL